MFPEGPQWLTTTSRPIEAKGPPLRKAGRFWAATHAILAVACLAFACLVVPRCEAIFLDFGAPLPAMTVTLIKASHLAIRFFYGIVVLGVALIYLDMVMLERLSAGEDRAPDTVLEWGLALALLLVAILGGTVGAMILPMVTVVPKLLLGVRAVRRETRDWA